jgi:rhamnogalacturonyl hydrolase YesR
MDELAKDSGRYLRVLEDVLDSAAEKDYAGYSKFDALNSPILNALSLKNKWLRILWTQCVKECPFNIRPLLGVRKSRNPKGIALFARAYLSLYEARREERWLNEAESLLKWLLDNPSPGMPQLCWGYNFIWQSPLFLQDIFEPNVVVTSFVGEALIHAWRVTKKQRYLDGATSTARFFLEQVPVIYDGADERAIAYVLRPVGSVVLNNNVLVGAFLTKVWNETGEGGLLDIATRLLNYTVRRRTDYCAWFYTEPPGKSHISHDNYHTGGILDGLLEYFEETGDARYQDVYWRGLDYYRTHLFEEDGAPRWMSDRRWPYDVHGAAQGIITFAKAAAYNRQYLAQARRCADWAIDTLYRPGTRDFAYRKGRFIKWNYSLMRWCNAWMARALGELVLRTGGADGTAGNG